MSTLIAHAEDLLARAENGEVCYTAFLTPAQRMELRASLGLRKCMRVEGGYKDAERCRVYFLPPYMLDVDEDTQSQWLADFFAESLIPLEIRGSGYRTLAHRDYLGAILNLGIEREALGDLCVCDEHRAVLFCDSVMCRFLCESLTRVSNDAVRVSPVTLPADFDGCRKFKPVTDTVASPRLDSVVAALASLSRERAQELIRAGAVELDFATADKADKPVAEGAVIVVRGKGKFIVRALSDKTKKGRFRLVADQYL